MTQMHRSTLGQSSCPESFAATLHMPFLHGWTIQSAPAWHDATIVQSPGHPVRVSIEVYHSMAAPLNSDTTYVNCVEGSPRTVLSQRSDDRHPHMDIIVSILHKSTAAYADAEPLSLATRDLRWLKLFLKYLASELAGVVLVCFVGVVVLMMLDLHGCCSPCVAVLCGWHKALSTFQSYVLHH